LSVDCFKTLRRPCRHNEPDVLIVYYYTHDGIGNILAFASVFLFLRSNPVQAGSGSNAQLTHPSHFMSTNTSRTCFIETPVDIVKAIGIENVTVFFCLNQNDDSSNMTNNWIIDSSC
jgi:hypothetical protein